jgi:poly(A) polymerase
LKDNLKKLSIERIREELSLMLLGAHPSGAFRLMLDLGVLEVILPEVAVLRGVEQPKLFHPEGDVFEHTMLMLEHMSYPSVELGWSILLHDIGKPATFFIGDDGRERFYCHEEQGAEIAEEILLRFKFPTRSIAKIVSAVRNHMRFAHVDKMRKAKWKRLMAEPGFFMELELHRIDCIASNGKLENYVLLLDRLAEAEHVVEVPEKLVSGRDLIDAGMKPGPEFKIILDKIVDLQLEGEIQTREQALEFIHRQA